MCYNTRGKFPRVFFLAMPFWFFTLQAKNEKLDFGSKPFEPPRQMSERHLAPTGGARNQGFYNLVVIL